MNQRIVGRVLALSLFAGCFQPVGILGHQKGSGLATLDGGADGGGACQISRDPAGPCSAQGTCTMGLVCVAGNCFGCDGDCSGCSASCGGCLDAAGNCQTGTSDSACGVNGVSCNACTGGAHCDGAGHCQTPDSGTADSGSPGDGGCDTTPDPAGRCFQGTCQQGLVCKEGNCYGCLGDCSACNPGCLGCLDAAGNCQPGNTTAACGASNQSCNTCSAGQICSPAGVCESQSPCGAACSTACQYSCFGGIYSCLATVPAQGVTCAWLTDAGSGVCPPAGFFWCSDDGGVPTFECKEGC